MPLVASGASECDGATPSGLTFTRASSATCTRSDGTLRTLSSNAPRVSARGLLVEGAATNLVLHSSDLSQAAWTKGAGITCTLVAHVEGNYSRCTNAGGTPATVSQALTAVAATRSTSLRLRGGTGTVEVRRDGASAYASVTAAASSASWVRAAPSCLSGDAYCTAVPTLSSGAADPVVSIRLGALAAVDISYVQDEAGAYATSPIATAGTAATRAGDVATTPRPAGFSDATGCLAATATFPPSVVGNQRITAFANSNNTSGAVNASTSLQAWDGANSTILLGLPALGGRSVRALTTWAGSALTLSSLTDGASNSGTYDGTWALGAIGIGSRTDGTDPLNGHLSNLVIDNTTTGCSQ
jgi:hypothetical protein